MIVVAPASIHLDSTSGLAYSQPPVRGWAFGFGVMAVTLGLTLSAPAAERLHGALLPDSVRKVGANRYHSTVSWDRTLRWFRRTYGRTEGVVWRQLPTTPQVEGWYLQNIRRGRRWDGILVYRAKGTRHIVVLPADENSV